MFNEDSTQRAFTRILWIQIAHFLSFVIRVLVDIAVLPQTILTVYLVSMVNFGIFAHCGYQVFIYLELYHGIAKLNSLRKMLPYAVPFLINLAMLLSSPLPHVYFGVNENAQVTSGSLWQLMIAINVLYPLAALVMSLIRDRDKIRRKEAGGFSGESRFYPSD